MNDIKITKREVLFSIIIIFSFITIGCFIHTKLNNSIMEKQQEYNQAIKIFNDSELFDYGLKTDIGSSFIYGELKAVDPVGFPELDGEYSYIEKVEERYTKHTRKVTETRTVNGKRETYETTEVYYSWDEVCSWDKHCSQITFLEKIFEYGRIHFPSPTYIKTISKGMRTRYVYYGTNVSYLGTIYTKIENNSISECSFYADTTIEELLTDFNSNWILIFFWISWILITGISVFGFYMLDNYWLED